MAKAVSKAQFRLFGALAGKGVKWAKDAQTKKHMKGLPERVKGGKGKKK